MHIEGLLVRSKKCLRDVLRVALNGEGITKAHPVPNAQDFAQGLHKTLPKACTRLCSKPAQDLLKTLQRLRTRLCSNL